MLPRRYVETYLFFVLRWRWPLLAGIAVLTGIFVGLTAERMTIRPSFFDLYPPDHPYIRLYTKYRSAFGTANVVQLVLEVKEGDLFTDPATIRKIDRLTLALLHLPAVDAGQVLS